MIEIRSHPRGISITSDDAVLLRSLMRRLEGFGDSGDILLHKNRLVMPLRVAPDIIGVLGEQQVLWEPGVRANIESQMDHQRMQLRARLEVAQALDDPAFALDGFPLLRNLDHHQAAAVAAISVPSLRGLALFDEQGTGKTTVALASFGLLRARGRIRRLLVVAPKSVLASWESDIERMYGQEFVVNRAIGAPNVRRRAIQNPHDILLTSYEALVREQGLIGMVLGAESNAYMLVIDESYFVKNADAIRSQAIAAIRPLCERALTLCGSPAPNSPVDVVNQINLTDGGLTFGGRQISKDPAEAARQVKSGLERTIYLRRLKEDVLPNLPGKEFERVIVELGPEQRSMYERARHELFLEAKNTSDKEFLKRIGNFLARRSVLLQICSHPGAVDPSYSETPAKLLALDYLLRELIETQGKKVVVWSFYRHSLEEIDRRFHHYGVARIDGSVPRIEDRVEAIRRFQNDPDTRLFVGNAAAAGAGLTLTAAHHAIYESFSNQAAHYMQSVDRIHRRGQASEVTSYVLLGRSTIELAEFERIQQKEDAARDLLGDLNRRIVTRTSFLEELELAV